MNYQRKIEHLELAVLSLTRAVNDLVGAVQAARVEKKGGPTGLLDTLHGDADSLVLAASKHVQEALESITESA
jgi:hypothetical protein